MIEIEVKGGPGPEALAELIATALHAQPDGTTSQVVIETGKLLREDQLQAQAQRPSWQQMETLNFTTIDEETDWSQV